MLNIFQNLTASSLYIDFNNPNNLSKVLRRTNISRCLTQLAAYYQNGALENQENDMRLAYAESSKNQVPRARIDMIQTKKEIAYKRRSLIAPRTLEHSPQVHAFMQARKSHSNNIIFARSKSLCIAIFCESHSISHRKTSILHRKLRCDTG